MIYWFILPVTIPVCPLILSLGFPKRSVFYSVKSYLTIYLLLKMASKINWTNFVLTVIKYAATLLIGYFGGNAVV